MAKPSVLSPFHLGFIMDPSMTQVVSVLWASGGGENHWKVSKSRCAGAGSLTVRSPVVARSFVLLVPTLLAASLAASGSSDQPPSGVLQRHLYLSYTVPGSS